jgi:hypothetical protein
VPKRVFIRCVDRVMSDAENRGAPASSNDDADQSGERGDSILDALDMEGVEDIEIAFDRPVSYLRPATFD